MSDYDLSGLKQVVYKDEGDESWYICPLCGAEMLEDFFMMHNGVLMCIDCWSERNPD